MAGSVLLIVVEGPAQRALFNRHLGGTAHHLVFATSGEDALARFAEVKPDLVVAHLRVGASPSGHFCPALRRLPRGEQVPVVILGEELADPVLGRERMAAHGADGMLPFPFDRPKLIEQITPLLAFGRMEPSGRGVEPLPAEGRRLTPEPALEKLRSVQVPPELAQEPRTDSSLPRGPALAGRPSAAELETRELPLGALAALVGELPIEDAVEAPTSDDEASDEIDWAAAAERPRAERPASAPGRALPESADTVVGFVNPFLLSPELNFPSGEVPVGASTPSNLPAFEAASSSLERTDGAGLAPPEASPAADVRVLDPRLSSSAVVGEAPSEAGRGVRALPRASSSRTDGRLEPRLDLRPEPARLERPDAPYRSSADVLAEPPIIDRPARDPLEELPISGLAPIPNHSDGSQAARMIQEPMRELTPSESDRGRRDAMAGGGRRGLDESQLGKRLAKRVRAMHLLLDEVDYYQLLGVARDAPPETVKRAYFDLSLEFHPDRFFLLRSGDLKEKIYAIYRRIAEAHAVLSDERRRVAYDEARFGRSTQDHLVGAPPSVSRSASAEGRGQPFEVVAAHPKARRFVELARLALDEGDVNAARLHLHLALAYEDHPSLRAAVAEAAELARPAPRL